MRMSEAQVGETYFLNERLDGEVRETYYTKVSETRYRHHGCIQGNLVLEVDERPRYVNFNAEGFEYNLVKALPVEPLSRSKFYQFVTVPERSTQRAYSSMDQSAGLRNRRFQVRPLVGSPIFLPREQK